MVIGEVYDHFPGMVKAVWLFLGVEKAGGPLSGVLLETGKRDEGERTCLSGVDLGIGPLTWPSSLASFSDLLWSGSSVHVIEPHQESPFDWMRRCLGP